MDTKQREELRNMQIKNFSSLNRYACKNDKAERYQYVDKDIRLEFARDVDRITYSNSYTRYAGKTQVYTLKDTDHVSMRGVHVQYVSRVSRAIARALSLNEDLCEAISLGHDIGHVPFGHLGEKFLNELSIKHTGEVFAHNVQSFRQLEYVELNGKGLNLTCQVLDGVLCHNGEILHKEYRPNTLKTKEELLEEYKKCYLSYENIKKMVPMTLEGCVVRISDIIAYIGKDIEDAISLGVIDKSDIPREITKVLGQSNSDIIDSLVEDIISNSLDKGYVSMSDEVYEALNCAKNFSYKYIYKRAYTDDEIKKYNDMFEKLFDVYIKALNENDTENDIYTVFYNKMNKTYTQNTAKERVVIDYIAGMTDRFICNQYKKYVLNEKKEGL